MYVVFDFDGTIAKSTPYHKIGWQRVLDEIGISEKMDILLPYEPGLKERFDSYRRIKAGFFKLPNVHQAVCSYFNNDDKDILVRDIMDLKESLTIKAIYDDKMHDAINKLAPNLNETIHILKNKNHKIGIISSTRATIISAFLFQCGILKLFDFVIGEELLTDNDGVLHDKPDNYGQKVATNNNWGVDVYIGDNDIVDKEFSQNCGISFFLADNETDFLSLIKKIENI